MLPEVEGQLAFLTPSILPDRPLHDRMGRLTCLAEGAAVLRLRGRLEAGLYRMALVTRPRSFDMSTVMLALTEWPSRRTVPAGPFDFDHTQYRMAVPTFRLTVNGRNWGLVWCEVPSPDDVQAGRIRAAWGFELEADGAVEIVLEVSPDDRTRLRWSDLDQMDLRPDDRYRLPLDGVATSVRHPRLFVERDTFERLGGPLDPVQAAFVAGIRAQAETGEDGSYVYRTITLALLGRLTGEQRWIDEAIARTLKLCALENWGYHDRPEIMGWNNDRDAGNRMMETAVVFDWLHDALTPEQRENIARKLAHQADIAYRITVLQRNYWYHRAIEAHGQGLWTGFTAAAAALLGHDPRAPGWLSWARGNFDDAGRHLPEDGIATWDVFNVIWHIFSLALLERLLGRRHEFPFGFFDTYPINIVHFRSDDFHDSALGVLLCYLAGRNRDPEASANALRLLDLKRTDQSCSPLFYPAFGLLFYDPALAPGRPTVPARAAATLGGKICCHGRDGVQFGFDCGTPLTPRVHAGMNFINRAWYGIHSSGTFTWWASGKPGQPGSAQTIVPAVIPGYRACTTHANLITVDGDGHYLEGRYLGATVPLARVPFIERFVPAADVTYCVANLAPLYHAAAEITHAARQWIFLHDANLLVMCDRIRTARPKEFAWYIHGHRGTWTSAARGAWRIMEEGYALTVRAIHTAADGVRTKPDAGCAADVVVQERVPSYTTGLNRYKNADWQPELYREKPDIAPMPALRFRLPVPVAAWDLVTIMGVNTEWAAQAEPVMAGAASGVRLPDGTRIFWPCGTPISIGRDCEVTADALVLGPGEPEPTRILAFQSSAWRAGGRTVPQQEPADLVWDGQNTAPRFMACRKARS